MVGESADRVNTGILYLKTVSLYGCMDVILGLSQHSYNTTISVWRGSQSLLLFWLRRALKQMSKVNPRMSHKMSILPFHKLMIWNSHSLIFITYVTISLHCFTFNSRFFSARLVQTDFFLHWGFSFSASHTDSSIMRASDVCQVSIHPLCRYGQESC